MTGTRAVEAYLAQVDSRLPGGTRRRRDVIDELRDGLMQALEHHGHRIPSDEAGRLLSREFGDPRLVGAAMAEELRLRLARRHAGFVLLLLVAGAAGWQLYYSLVGVASSAMPSGWGRPLFLIGIDALKVCATIAQIGAALTILIASLPVRRPAVTVLSAWSARLTVAALAGFGISALSMLFSIAPAHRLDAALANIPVIAVTLLAIRWARSATRLLVNGTPREQLSRH